LALNVRRVVTGHDASGRAIVKIDEITNNVSSRRPGQSACVIGPRMRARPTTQATVDDSLRAVGTTLANGTVFRIIEYAPAFRPACIARTRSTTRS